MKKFHLPEAFKHGHPRIRNVNEIFYEQLTYGQRASDWVAMIIGSWRFIIIQSALLVVWVILNVLAFIKHWDPYPFILMNLVLSLQAAYTAPVIMMSQNRLEAKDRLESHNDYLINLKAEEEIRTIIAYLETQSETLKEVKKHVIDSPSKER